MDCRNAWRNICWTNWFNFSDYSNFHKYLIVAGGGAGGLVQSNSFAGGGGGAGRIYSVSTSASGLYFKEGISYAVVVGAGGTSVLG